MQVKTTSGSGAAGLGIIGTGLALALPDAKWIGWALVVAGLFVFIFDIRLERGHIAVGSSKSVRERLRRMWPQYLMILSGALFFVGLIGFLQLNVTPSKQKEAEADFSPPNLADYFAKDFGFLSIDRTIQSRVQNLANGLDQVIEVKIRIFRDFGSNAEFAALFIPTFSDARLTEMADQFIDHMKPEIKKAREEAQQVGTNMKIPGTPYSNSKDLVFSGRVYVYTMNALDPVQLGHVVESYRNDGMFLEVRGSDYLFFQSRHAS